MKLGSRITSGFGLLIIIAIALGGMAVWNMWSVAAQSTMLAKEYAPEVKVANDVERQSLMTMYAMRGYAYTEEDSFLKTGQEHLAKVKTHLDAAGKLAEDSPHLVKLREHVKEARAAVDDYKNLANQTVEKNEALKRNRADMGKAAELYMKNCYEFLKSQDEALDREAKAGARGSQTGRAPSEDNLSQRHCRYGQCRKAGQLPEPGYS